MSVMKFNFRLFGGRKGQTVSINGHPFINGHCSLIQSAENAGNCARVLSFYGAYHEGSDEYKVALAAELAEEEKANGSGKTDKEAKQHSSEKVRSEAGQTGARSSKEGPTDLSGTDSSTGGGAGESTAGDGHEHTRVPEFTTEQNKPKPTEPETVVDESIKAAVMKLDPEVEDHWVKTGPMRGKPKCGSVEEALGRAGVTREDVEAAVPGWDRDRALEAALAA